MAQTSAERTRAFRARKKAEQGVDPISQRPKSTLRDKFALAALTGLCANPAISDMEPDEVQAAFARTAYQLADVMLKKRAE